MNPVENIANIKPKDERVKEAINLLKQLRDIGLHQTDIGYTDLKKEIDLWIHQGKSWTGTILFPRLVRKGYFILPIRPGAVASCQLKAV